MSSGQNIRCDISGQEFDSFNALKEYVRSETEDKKHKNNQGFDAHLQYWRSLISRVLAVLLDAALICPAPGAGARLMKGGISDVIIQAPKSQRTNRRFFIPPILQQ